MKREPLLTSYLLTTLFVILGHGLILWSMTLSSFSSPKALISPKLVVKTIKLNPLPIPSVQIPSEIVVMQEVMPLAEPQAIAEPVIKEAIPSPPASSPSKLEPEPIKPISQKPPSTQPKPEPAKLKTVPPKTEPTKPKPIPKPKNNPAPKKTTPPNSVPKIEKKENPKKEPLIKDSIKEAPKKPPAPPKPTPEEIAVQESAKALQREEEAKVRQREEAIRAHQRELLAQANESLAKVGVTREKISTSKFQSTTISTTLPAAIGSLQIEALPDLKRGAGELSAREISYQEEVASRLKRGLKLPCHGEIKVKLILNRTGKVSAIQIIRSENEKNKQYIEKTLPSLTFSSFGNRFEGFSEYTFVITLHNE